MPTDFIRRGRLLLCALACALLAPGALQAQQHEHDAHEHAQVRHPDPRPGVGGEGVLRGEIVPSRAREAYTIAARIPSILDGLYCHCECHEVRGRRSLLECFEDEMASRCGICMGEARLAHELHGKGKSLDEIRKSVDERYGG